MPSPYPLPQGCIFREEFRNPTLAARNGLVITGNPWLSSGVLVGSGMKILVPRFTSVLRSGTFVFDIDAKGFDGGFRSIGFFSSIYIGFANTTNRIFLLDNTFAYSNSYSLGRHVFAAVFDEANASFFQDGIAIGTTTFTRRGTSAGTFSIGSLNDGTALAGVKIYSFYVFNRALSAEEIRQHYYLTSGK